MEFKGMDQLRRHVPDLQTRGGEARVGLTILGMIALVTLFFLGVDHGFPEWMPDGEIVVMAIGFLVMSLFVSRKKVYQQKYGELAYRNAFAHYALPGLGIIFATMAHVGHDQTPTAALRGGASTGGQRPIRRLPGTGPRESRA